MHTLTCPPGEDSDHLAHPHSLGKSLLSVWRILGNIRFERIASWTLYFVSAQIS